jgi:uridine phosphorylase
MQEEYPILEFDATPEAILEPGQIIKRIDIPEHAIPCFFQDVITQLSQHHAARVITHLKSEFGTHPIYEIDIAGERLAVFHPGVGGPLAGGMLEEVIALGSTKFIACGGQAPLMARWHSAISSFPPWRCAMRAHHTIIFPQVARYQPIQKRSKRSKRY